MGIERSMLCQPDSPVVHNAVLHPISQDIHNTIAAQKEKSTNDDDRGKNANGEQESICDIGGDLFQCLFLKTDKGTDAHQNDSSS